jgi:hypothetical protein
MWRGKHVLIDENRQRPPKNKNKRQKIAQNRQKNA